jgi:uncharacterized membrane protein YgcG
MITAITLSLAMPCLTPIHHAHLAHHARPEPVQSCTVLPAPMCFRETPEPDILPVSTGPLTYYTAPPDINDEPIASSYLAELTVFGGIGGGGDSGGGSYSIPGGNEGGGGGSTGGGGGGGYPPPNTPPAPPRTVLAPELSAGTAMSAFILLLGGCALLKGRKS